MYIRDAHGPGWPAGRAGPGRTGLTFLGPRAERAENGPKPSTERNKIYLKKPKFIIKLT